MRSNIGRRSFAFLLLLSLLNVNLPATASPQAQPDAGSTTAELRTVEFEQNVGQFDPQVKYVARAAGSTLFLTGDKAMYVLPFAESDGPKADGDMAERSIQRFHAVSMTFANANRDVAHSGGNISEHRTNYFLGSDESRWRSNVPNFGEVRFHDLYEGISAVWYGRENGATRYDLVVDPNADAGQIELRFDGADSISIDDEGSLIINTPAGTIKQNKPFTYQAYDEAARIEVPSRFAIEGTTVRFALGDYDRSRELVIDPTVSFNNPAFSTFIGSFGNDLPNDIAVDANGNSYITGRTLSTSFPTTVGTLDTTANGQEDVFVTKFNSSGTGIVFSTFLGGTFYDEGNAIAVDPSGNVYTAGSGGIAFPTTGGAFDPSYNGGADVFVTKLNATGSALIYSTYIGAAQIEIANDLAIDAAGNAYLAVRVNNSGGGQPYPTTFGAFDTTENGSDDVAVSKLDPTGSSLVYSTFLGGSSIDSPNSIAVNTAGEVFVGGSTTDDVADFPVTAGAFDTTHNGSTDFFMTRISVDGSALVYSTMIGGLGIDNANAVTIDAAGNAYIAGNVSTGFPTTAGVLDTTAAGSGEIGVSKVSPTGSSLIYSTFVGGTQGETIDSIAVDNFSHLYLTGNNFLGDYPVTGDAFDATFNGSNDAILTVINAAATALIYSTYIGGTGADLGSGIALDTTGNVYLTGRTIAGAAAFPTTAQAYQSFNGGGTDGFVSKFGDFSIGGKVIDTAGNPMPNVMVALSGQVSGNVVTGSDGRFGFTDTVVGEPHSVTTTRSGYTINPTIFNIASLGNNRELIFVGTPGSPSGGAGGTLLFQNLSYNKSENGNSVVASVSRTGIVSSQTPVTVDWATSNGTAIAGEDYIGANGQLAFGPFETSKTITIQLLNDTTLEPRETFSITMSNPTNSADIDFGRTTTTVNVLDEDIKGGSLLISEFRQRGRLGANDEYIKLFNPNDFDVTVNTSDGSSGLTLARTDGEQALSVVMIPNLVTIRSRGHYLLTNNSPSGGFSIVDFPTGIGTTTASGDQVFSNDIPDNSGLVLLNTANNLFFTQDNAVDRIAFAGSPWAEGDGLIPIAASNFESCFVRKLDLGRLIDTGNNRNDLLLLDNHSRLFAANDGSKVYSALGTPAPETSESLRMMLPSEVSITEIGTEVHDPMPVPNGVGGTLTMYRQITNNTSEPITAIRLRAIDFPTAGSSLQRRTSSRPDLRLLSSTDSVGVFGVSLAGERLQPNGGGINSTLNVNSVTSQTPLMPGQSITVAVRFGVMRWGRHPFTAAIEATN